MEKMLIANRIRGISPNIFKKYSYSKDGNNNHLVTHYDVDGNEVGFKRTYDDRTYDFMGSVKSAVPFGLNLFRSGGKVITITESEIDCLSIAETFDGKWPVISVNNGIATAKEELMPYMEKINSYEQINLYFKNNAESQIIAKEVASLFPPGKTFTITSNEYDDANAALMAGKHILKNIFYEARQITPVGIVNANEGGVDSLLEDDDTEKVYDTPYGGVELIKRAILTIISGSGMGKTTFTKEIAYHLLMHHKLKVGYVGLEENNKTSKRGFIGINMNKPLMNKKAWNKFKEEEENIKEFKESYQEVIAPGNLFLFNHFGSMDSKVLLDKLRYLVLGAKCDFIILDHISIAVAGQQNVDERKAIDALMENLRSLVEETGVGMILISHLKRLDGNKGHEDGMQLSSSHIRGSGGILQMSDSVIGLEGNQQDEQEKNYRTIRMLKDRQNGETGVLSRAVYDKETGRLMPAHSPDWPVNLEDVPF